MRHTFETRTGAHEDKCTKNKPQVHGLQFAALENQDSTGTAQQYWQLTVRQHCGVIVTLHHRGNLLVSDIISRFAPGSAVLVYHGTRLLFNDDRIQASELAVGCCLEIREWIGGGGGGCSRISPVDGNLEDEAAASAKEISSLRLRVVALEAQLGKDQAVNETSSEDRLGTGNVAGFIFQALAIGVSQPKTVVSLPQQKKRK
jgi:hypothetical protein